MSLSAAVCDVWEHNRNRAVEMTGGKARAFSDFRRVLELDEVDAVVISHSRSLACAYCYCRLPGGQGCVCGKTAGPNHP